MDGQMTLLDNQWIHDRDGRWLISMDYHNLIGPRINCAHRHHELEISCVPSGTGIYHINDRFFDIRPGDVFLMSNTDYHGLNLRANERILNMVVHFDPAFIWNSLTSNLDYNFLLIFFERNANFCPRLDRNNPATAHIFSLLMEMWQELTEKRLGYELMVKIKLQTILTEILRYYDYVDLGKNSRRLGEQDIAPINEAIAYIDRHLSENIRLADLAAIAHVSPAYFSTLFKRLNGLSPIEYIVHKRIQLAVEEICTTTKSLTEIAMDCGFNNSTNFYKAFRKVTGRTPVSYRQPKEAADARQKSGRHQLHVEVFQNFDDTADQKIVE